MPIQQCHIGGKPGYKYGQEGHCYTYTPGDAGSRERAHAQAAAQAAAIHASQAREGKK